MAFLRFAMQKNSCFVEKTYILSKNIPFQMLGTGCAISVMPLGIPSHAADLGILGQILLHGVLVGLDHFLQYEPRTNYEI